MARGQLRRYLGNMNEISRIDPESARPERQRKPDWIRVKAPTSAGFAETRRLMRSKNLSPVDRKSVVQGKGVSVRVNLWGRRIIKKKKKSKEIKIGISRHKQKQTHNKGI